MDGLRDQAVTREEVVERLRAAIARRRSLRPGSPAHWSNECEIKVLQRALTQDLLARSRPKLATPLP